MGKGRIVEAVGDGLYKIIVERDVAAVKQRIAELKNNIFDWMANRLPSAKTEAQQALYELNRLADNLELQSGITLQEQLRIETQRLDLALKYQEKRAAITQLEADIVAMRVDLNRLERVAADEAPVDAWCADYSPSMEGEVGTVEVPGERYGVPVLIQPGHEGAATYSGERDGKIQPVEAGTPEQVFWNWAMLPAWQKWRPNYRIGTISALTGNTCTVTLDKAESSQQSIDVNYQSVFADVEIQYMTCNGSAFKDGDRVLVAFEDVEDSILRKPKVIGFEKNPKPCGEWGIVYWIYSLNYSFIEEKNYAEIYSTESDSWNQTENIDLQHGPEYWLSTDGKVCLTYGRGNHVYENGVIVASFSLPVIGCAEILDENSNKWIVGASGGSFPAFMFKKKNNFLDPEIKIIKPLPAYVLQWEFSGSGAKASFLQKSGAPNPNFPHLTITTVKLFTMGVTFSGESPSVDLIYEDFVSSWERTTTTKYTYGRPLLQQERYSEYFDGTVGGINPHLAASYRWNKDFISYYTYGEWAQITTTNHNSRNTVAISYVGEDLVELIYEWQYVRTNTRKHYFDSDPLITVWERVGYTPSDAMILTTFDYGLLDEETETTESKKYIFSSEGIEKIVDDTQTYAKKTETIKNYRKLNSDPNRNQTVTADLRFSPGQQITELKSFDLKQKSVILRKRRDDRPANPGVIDRFFTSSVYSAINAWNTGNNVCDELLFWKDGDVSMIAYYSTNESILPPLGTFSNNDYTIGSHSVGPFIYATFSTGAGHVQAGWQSTQGAQQWQWMAPATAIAFTGYSPTAHPPPYSPYPYNPPAETQSADIYPQFSLNPAYRIDLETKLLQNSRVSLCKYSFSTAIGNLEGLNYKPVDDESWHIHPTLDIPETNIIIRFLGITHFF